MGSRQICTLAAALILQGCEEPASRFDLVCTSPGNAPIHFRLSLDRAQICEGECWGLHAIRDVTEQEIVAVGPYNTQATFDRRSGTMLLRPDPHFVAASSLLRRLHETKVKERASTSYACRREPFSGFPEGPKQVF